MPTIPLDNESIPLRASPNYLCNLYFTFLILPTTLWLWEWLFLFLDPSSGALWENLLLLINKSAMFTDRRALLLPHPEVRFMWRLFPFPDFGLKSLFGWWISHLSLKCTFSAICHLLWFSFLLLFLMLHFETPPPPAAWKPKTGFLFKFKKLWTTWKNEFAALLINRTKLEDAKHGYKDWQKMSLSIVWLAHHDPMSSNKVSTDKISRASYWNRLSAITLTTTHHSPSGSMHPKKAIRNIWLSVALLIASLIAWSLWCVPAEPGCWH